MVKEIVNGREFANLIAVDGLVVVDFFATWCGPCITMAPILDILERKYDDVKFYKVDVDKCGDISSEYGVSAMPTFIFFVHGKKVDEIKGANAAALEEKIKSLRPPKRSSSPSFIPPPEDIREARLRAFQKSQDDSKRPRSEVSSVQSAATAMLLAADDGDESFANSKSTTTDDHSLVAHSKSTSSCAMDEDDEEIANAIALSIALSSCSSSNTELSSTSAGADTSESNALELNDEGDELIPIPVNEDLLRQMLDMGFSDVRSRKGLTHGSTLEEAIQYISEHQDDPMIDQPYLVKKSDALKESQRTVPMTEEEKEAALVKYKEKARQRRQEREAAEKIEELKREKERRERGQLAVKAQESQEQREKMLKKIEMDKAKKEKEDSKRERERLRLEIARDKELRAKNKGMLPSVLGVDGYNPSAVNMKDGAVASQKTSSAPSQSTTLPSSSTSSSSSSSSSTKPPAAVVPKKESKSTSSAVASSLSAEERIDSAIQTMMSYRTGGDGGKALTLLITFVKNIVEKPDEIKYQTINLDGKAYMEKLKPLVGPSIILRSLGFEKMETENKLKFGADPRSALMSETLAKLQQAEQTYNVMNG